MEEQVKTFTEQEVNKIVDHVMQSYNVMMDRVHLYQSIIESDKYPEYIVKYAIDGLWKIINPEGQCRCNDCSCKEETNGQSK